MNDIPHHLNHIADSIRSDYERNQTRRMSQHTPGPWTASGTDGKNTTIIVSEWGEVCRLASNPANERLIAAAPEMLEALTQAAEVMELALARAKTSTESSVIAARLDKVRAVLNEVQSSAS